MAVGKNTTWLEGEAKSPSLYILRLLGNIKWERGEGQVGRKIKI